MKKFIISLLSICLVMWTSQALLAQKGKEKKGKERIEKVHKSQKDSIQKGMKDKKTKLKEKDQFKYKVE
ncbi:hypothetical protein [Labilibaculum euxinus]